MVSLNEAIVAEIKNGISYNFVPTFKILIHANQRLLTSDKTSGFRRRSLEIETPKAVIKVDPELFYKLTSSIEGLIAWALATPKSICRFGNSIEAINTMTCRNSYNPMLDWALRKLMPDKNAYSILGAKQAGNIPNSLYSSYCQYMWDHDFEPCPSNQFGVLLLDLLGGQRLSVEKARMNGGTVVKGIRLRKPEDGTTIAFPAFYDSVIKDLKTLDPFLGIPIKFPR